MFPACYRHRDFRQAFRPLSPSSGFGVATELLPNRSENPRDYPLMTGRSITLRFRAATTTSPAICRPRVIGVTFIAYICRIYVLTFRIVSGFESLCPLAQMSQPISAGCSSDRSFAYSFLQIPSHEDTLAVRLAAPTIRGLQRTFNLKSTKWPPQPHCLRLHATLHAWPTKRCRVIDAHRSHR